MGIDNTGEGEVCLCKGCQFLVSSTLLYDQHLTFVFTEGHADSLSPNSEVDVSRWVIVDLVLDNALIMPSCRGLLSVTLLPQRPC